MSDFLERFGAASRARAAAAKRRRPEANLLRAAAAAPPAPALKLAGFDLIAELKLRSPAAGGLAVPGFDRTRQLTAYAEGGAAAVSVLTEPDEFHGSLEHLQHAAELLAPFGCPVMRKDFLTDPYQLIEARAHGAGGALLIVAMLDDAELVELMACGRELGLFLLLEAFDGDDLERIAQLAVSHGRTPSSAAPLLAGVNCRNLRTLEVDFDRFSALAGHLPAGLPGVAESGMTGPADIQTVSRLGYRLALVGSALMRATPAARRNSTATAGRNTDRNGAAAGALRDAARIDRRDVTAASVRRTVAELIAAGRGAQPCS